ncbi:hypothetical protein [uncultured Deinococcus sp.]|uniref:hypothetical protein n=1 Tax=uncultured Deinococcus sp. TaxID=158789 RepID=UPI00258BA74B|nr:hypothetical protein [uncultured Deinococcus sp.]
MLHPALPLALLTGLMLAATPNPECRIEATIAAGPNLWGQYQIRLAYPLGCRSGSVLWVRLLTQQGGTIPPIGHFNVSAGYPREVHYWVRPGVKAQQQIGLSWHDLPIRNLPRGWFR